MALEGIHFRARREMVREALHKTVQASAGVGERGEEGVSSGMEGQRTSVISWCCSGDFGNVYAYTGGITDGRCR